MSELPRLVLELVEGVPLRLGGEDDGVALQVDQLRVELPLEASLTSTLELCSPRRRTRTGFDAPMARITLGLVRYER